MKYTLMALLSITCGSLEAFTVPCEKTIVYDRSIVVAKQDFPTADVVVLDKNHKAMKNSEAFTDAEVNDLDQQAIDDFFLQYGINMDGPNVVKLSSGVRILDNVAILEPIVYGNSDEQPWIVVRDTANPKREYKYRQKEYLTRITFLANYTVPVGFSQQGANVAEGSAYFRGYVVQGKLNQNWKNPKNREIFTSLCTQVTAQTGTMWQKNASAITSTLIDSRYNVGFGLDTTVDIKVPGNHTGANRTEGRIVYTWDNIADCSDHCYQ